MSLADQRTNPLQLVNALSLRYQGPFDARPEDGVGLCFSWIKLSRSYRHNQAALNQAEGIDDYRDPRHHPQPDLQYWYRPGGLKTTQDAWVTGLKTTVTF
ncbi:carbohydrate porin|nr:carbohydrate porin [Candidatus Pantoea persica]